MPTERTRNELGKVAQSVMFTDEDRRALERAGSILEPQTDQILDLWYGFVGSHPHLVAYFSDEEGNPIGDYLEAVRARFGQWISDTCRRPHDTDWLAYQEEIGRRHHRMKKNQTDGADAVPHIPLRYLIAFIYPITATIRDFLARGADSPEEVEEMFHAWFKVVVMQVALWSRPYAGDAW